MIDLCLPILFLLNESAVEERRKDRNTQQQAFHSSQLFSFFLSFFSVSY